MGKKNYDSLLHNILGGAEIRPQDRFEAPADEKNRVKSIIRTDK